MEQKIIEDDTKTGPTLLFKDYESQKEQTEYFKTNGVVPDVIFNIPLDKENIEYVVDQLQETLPSSVYNEKTFKQKFTNLDSLLPFLAVVYYHNKMITHTKPGTDVFYYLYNADRTFYTNIVYINQILMSSSKVFDNNYGYIRSVSNKSNRKYFIIDRMVEAGRTLLR